MLDTKKLNGKLTNAISREQVETLLIKQLMKLFGKQIGEKISSESRTSFYKLEDKKVSVHLSYGTADDKKVYFDASLDSDDLNYTDTELELDVFCRVNWCDQDNQSIIANDIFCCLLTSITLPQLVKLINSLSKDEYFDIANTYYIFQQYYNNFGYKFNEELNTAFLKFCHEHMDDFIDWLIINEKILDKAFAQSKNADKYAAITYAIFINNSLVTNNLDKAKSKTVATKLLDWSNKVNITDQSIVAYAISSESDKLCYKLKLQYLPAIAATVLDHDKEEEEDNEVIYLDNLATNLATINFEIKDENDIDMFVDEIVDNPPLIPAIKKIVHDYPDNINYNNHQKDLKALATTAKRHNHSSVFKAIYKALHEIFNM